MVSIDGLLRDESHPPVASAVVYKTEDKVIAKKWLESRDRWIRIAKGKAGVDDAEVIQDAVNYVNKDCGGYLQLKSGHYKVSRTIYLDKDIVICGETAAGGRDATRKGTLIESTISDKSPVFKVLNNSYSTVYITIERMKVIGNKGSDPFFESRDHINPYTLTDYVVLRDIEIVGMGSHGIYIPSRAEFWRLENLRIINCNGSGIYHENNSIVASVFDGLNLSGNSEYGLYANSLIGCEIVIYQASGNGVRGVHIKNGNYYNLRVLYTENNGTEGVYATGMGGYIELGYIQDGYTVTGTTTSYRVGHSLRPRVVKAYQSDIDYLYITYYIRPAVQVNTANIKLQKYKDGTYVDVASFGGSGFVIYDIFDPRGMIKNIFPIVLGTQSIPAGSTVLAAKFTVPTGKTLKIHAVAELYDPDGCISAEVYNVTDATTVTGEIDGFDDTGWEVPEGKEVEFRVKNSDTGAAHDGNYGFLVSFV